MNDSADSPDLNAAELRRAFGQFATGVTIVTAPGPVGFTANSFSSVSLSPPLVQWSVDLSSERHDIFAHAKYFSIHIIDTTQRDLAEHFARVGEGFGSCDWHIGAYDIPQIKGCLARFDCRQYAVHPAGDHSLIIGEVLNAEVGNASDEGLIFYQSRYGAFTPL
ncbi:MAG: flavin reductase family protein [Paracoccaceae bacterium]